MLHQVYRPKDLVFKLHNALALMNTGLDRHTYVAASEIAGEGLFNRKGFEPSAVIGVTHLYVGEMPEQCLLDVAAEYGFHPVNYGAESTKKTWLRNSIGQKYNRQPAEQANCITEHFDIGMNPLRGERIHKPFIFDLKRLRVGPRFIPEGSELTADYTLPDPAILTEAVR